MVSVVGSLGDLAMSTHKRMKGLKNTGTILSGHGAHNLPHGTRPCECCPRACAQNPLALSPLESCPEPPWAPLQRTAREASKLHSRLHSGVGAGGGARCRGVPGPPRLPPLLCAGQPALLPGAGHAVLVSAGLRPPRVAAAHPAALGRLAHALLRNHSGPRLD
eukprot:scaffold7379_cov366-Prasinococcus_capsulatus_cf.AAC.1